MTRSKLDPLREEAVRGGSVLKNQFQTAGVELNYQLLDPEERGAHTCFARQTQGILLRATFRDK